MSAPHRHRQHRLVPAALFVAVLSISLAASLFRKAAPTHPLVMAGVRLAVAALCLSPFVVRSFLTGRMKGRQFRLAVLAGFIYAVHFGAWVSSLTLTSVASSVTLVTTTPLLLGLLGLVTGRDRPDRKLWIALGIAAAGLTLIGWRDLHATPSALAGDALAFLGAGAIAAYMLTVRALGEEIDLWAFSGIATAVGAVALAGTAVVAGIPFEAASTEAFGYLVLAAVIPQLLGHNLITWVLRHVRPSTVAMAILGEPVGAALIAWVWLGEAVGPLAAAGCTVTLIAVGIAVWERPTGRYTS